MISIIKLLRPKHYIKNLFVFLPIFFAGNFLEWPYIVNSLVGFVLFCIGASSVYVINDINDVEKDKNHPTKKYRPLAAEKISKKTATILFFILFLISLIVAYLFTVNAFYVLLIYIGINILYTYVLKKMAIYDIITIAIGFILRLFMGAAVTGVPLSEWIILMTFLLSLLMALAKRRDDIVLSETMNKPIRSSLKGYSKQYVDIGIGYLASVTTVVYILYTIVSGIKEKIDTPYLLHLTSIFVIIGLLRYLQIIFVEQESGSPTDVLLRDRFIQMIIILWGFTFFIILYRSNF